MGEGLTEGLADGLGEGLPPTLVTKVIMLRAGSVTVREPFDMLVVPWGATFLVASVSQDETLDAVLFARVNCWLTAEVPLLTATMTTVELAPLYAETKTFDAGFA